MAVPSPEGVRIVFPVINFVLNALTLKYSAIKMFLIKVVSVNSLRVTKLCQW